MEIALSIPRDFLTTRYYLPSGVDIYQEGMLSYLVTGIVVPVALAISLLS